jgi:hypothetical protein
MESAIAATAEVEEGQWWALSWSSKYRADHGSCWIYQGKFEVSFV